MTTPARLRTAALAAAGVLAAVALGGVTAPAASAAGHDSAGRDGAGAGGGDTATRLTLVRTRTSLLGTHRWYAQTYHGLPVVGGWYARHYDRAGRLTSEADGRVALGRAVATTPRVSAASAAGTAERAVAARRGAPADKRRSALPTGDATGTARLAVQGGAAPRLVWQVTTTAEDGSATTLVDARSGAAATPSATARNATGKGRVFDPNPVVTLRDESLRDRNDADQAVLLPAYRTVALPHLDGSGYLRGTYVRVVAAQGGRAHVPSGDFRYRRHSDRFEQVNAYYQLDHTQTYLHRLGFVHVNNESQRIATNTIDVDNSFYDPATDQITYGRGGVDDAEDAEVVWHEYGHAIQDDQVPGFGASEQAGAIGEGFGDYWAVTNSVPVSHGFDLPCVMDWDSTAYTTTKPHCLRRTDTKKTVDDVDGEVHDDGEIWSAALWNIQTSLGRRTADRVVIESQFSYRPDTTFKAAAKRVVATAKAMYGADAAAACTKAFQKRKIL